MNHRVALHLAAADGVLLRVLGTIERRGFRVLNCVATGDGRDGYRVQVDVDGARDPRVLCRQLARLIDVREVTQLDAREVAPVALGTQRLEAN